MMYRFDAIQSPTSQRDLVERRAGETVDHLLLWFKNHNPGDGAANPFFVWLHLYDPHAPYDPPEPFHTQYAGHLYDGEIAYADSQLGRLFDYLRRAGVYDRTLIVLMSDHGESLGEHGESEHGYFVYRSTLRVPLIFKLPRAEAGGNEPRVVSAPVGAIDVPPTLLELAQIQDPISRQFQGASLRDLILNKSRTTDRPVYSESYYANTFGWSPLRSVSTAKYQFIDAPKPELYDLSRDPSQKRNLYAQQGAETAALREQLTDIERRYTDQKSSSQAGAALSADAVEKLRSLGYAAFVAPAATTDQKNLDDPKDHIEAYKAYMRSVDFHNTGQYAQEETILKTWLAKDPHLFLFRYTLGRNAMSQRHWEEAREQMVECLKLDPSREPVMLSLADIATGDGKPDEAIVWLDLDISRNPQSSVAYAKLATLAMSRSDRAEAQRDFQRALEVNPYDLIAQKGLGLMLVDMGQYDEGAKHLEVVDSYGSNDPAVYGALGTAYLNTNHPKQAIQACQKALALRGDFPEARLNLALAYLRAGDRGNAQSEFRTACAEGNPKCQQYEKQFR